MRNVIVLAAFTLAIAVPQATRAAEIKIGFVNLQQAVIEVEEGKTAREALKKEFEQKQKMLDDKQNELKRLKDDLEKQMVVMSDEAKREKAMDFERKVNEMQQVYVQMQKDLSEREREMMKVIFDKMESVIKDIAQAEGYAFVFEQQNAGLIVAPPSGNMTNELVRRYNAKYKGSAPAKKADGKKAAPAATPAATPAAAPK
jgi:outer membrane protein